MKGRTPVPQQLARTSFLILNTNTRPSDEVVTYHIDQEQIQLIDKMSPATMKSPISS